MKILDLKGLKPGRWYKFHLDFRRQKISEKIIIPGIYAFFINDRLQYIGESRNIAKRLNQHIENLYKFLPKSNKVEIRVRPDKNNERYELEPRLILRLKPPGNHYENIVLRKSEEKIEFEIPKKYDDKELNLFNLSRRTLLALKANKITTIRELREATTDFTDFIRLILYYPRVGEKSIREIINLLEKLSQEEGN